MPPRNDGTEFEARCQNILINLGWKVTTTPITGDRGIDLKASRETWPGTQKIGCQCKDYRGNKVRGNEVREFIGALTQSNFRIGYFFTTSDFTEEAYQAAQDARNTVQIKLFNGVRVDELDKQARLREEITHQTYETIDRQYSQKHDQLHSIYVEKLNEVEQTFTREILTHSQEIRASKRKNTIFNMATSLIAIFCAFQVLSKPTFQSSTPPSKSIATTQAQATQQIAPRATHHSTKIKNKSDPFHSNFPSLAKALKAHSICDHVGTINKIKRYVSSHKIRTTRERLNEWNRVMRAADLCSNTQQG